MKTSLSSKIVATALALSLSCAAPAAFAQNNSISPGYLTGTWMDNAQCVGSAAMVFFPNTTVSSAGSQAVNYAVTGPSQFTMYGPGGGASIQAQYVNQNQMVLTLNNDTAMFYRCGANASAGGSAQLTPAYIVGNWGQNGNCAVPEVFAAGGHFRTSNHDQGTWALFGNTLRMTINNGLNIDFSVQPNGHGNMTLVQNNNGQVSHYIRCP